MDVATEAAIRALLAEHPNLDADDILTQVLGQRVLLRGRVRTQRERMEAEAAVRQVYGIEQVDNELLVTGEPI
ncbi:MAG: BON domain-containing protein [Armatimonadetes bacterium]|jgi:osmotically-inducible protein OsmY|nr:BON domain-containing protein [Armatimonadota bacterium]